MKIYFSISISKIRKYTVKLERGCVNSFDVIYEVINVEQILREHTLIK